MFRNSYFEVSIGLTNVGSCAASAREFINSRAEINCPKDFKAVYYKRYVDDIFVLFNKPEHAQFFLEYMNKKHKNMKFSIETEMNGSLSFLDVKIFRENDTFVTSVFRKETLVGCTLILSVLFHLSTSLVWYTPY